MHQEYVTYSTRVHEDLVEMDPGEFVVYPFNDEIMTSGRNRYVMISGVSTEHMFAPVDMAQARDGSKFNYAYLDKNQVRVNPQNNTHEAVLIGLRRRLPQEHKRPPSPTPLPLVPCVR